MAENDDFYLPEDVLEWMAQKKSELLADLLKSEVGQEISWEKQMDYEVFIPSAVQNPDEQWRRTEGNHEWHIFGKLLDSGVWLIVFVHYSIHTETEDTIWVPFLHVATKNPKLMEKFRKGECLKKLSFN